MRQSGSEKLETIRVVEDSELSVTATLRELGRASEHVLRLVSTVQGTWIPRFVGSAFRTRLLLEPDPGNRCVNR